MKLKVFKIFKKKMIPQKNNFFRLLFILFTLIIVSPSALSQIPNSGFENWTNGNPDGWITDNDFQDGFVPITLTADSHSGSYALKGEVTALQGIPLNPVLGIVFPFNERPASLSGYYKFTQAGSDSLVIIVSLGSSRDSAGAGGGGSLVIKNTVNDYTEFNIPIYWVSKNQPDSCVITFTIYPKSTGSHTGTAYYIDDLSFSASTTNVENVSSLPEKFNLDQNYPNPFNPSTKIRYEIPESGFVVMKVYNILGKEVAALVNGHKEAGNYEVEFNPSNLSAGVQDLPGGVYFYRLSIQPSGKGTEKFSDVKKMIYLK